MKDLKIREALELIQAAHSTLREAAARVSLVDGYADAYGQACRLCDTVEAGWHELNDFRPEEAHPRLFKESGGVS